METRLERDGEVDSWKEAMLDYNSALKQIETKLNILNDELQHIHRYNPIEHIKDELIECSKMIADLDARMLSLNEEILEIEAKQKAEKQKK